MAQQNATPTGNKSIADESKNQSNTFPLSPAELYITQQSQMVFDSNDSLPGTSSIASSNTSSKHAEKMHEWHEKKVNEIYKHEPYRYKYGTPPSTFRRSDCQTDSYNRQTSTSLSSTNQKMRK